MIRDAIAQIIEGADVDARTLEMAMDDMLSGNATPAQTAALLIALRMKGETTDELAGAARAMRAHSTGVHVRARDVLLDTCGTGGDGSGTFNISTLAAIVVSACGIAVAKHGNRAASSKVGSADLLEQLGVGLDLSAEQVARCIDEVGIGFMFARAHHPAMRHAGPVRAELGVRTIFNLLGPLTNPAGATHQLMGVYDPERLEQMAYVLRLLGSRAAWVVHGAGGLDEVSLWGPTRVAELRDGAVRTFELTPADFGLGPVAPDALAGGDVADNLRIARSILAAEPGAARDAVVANAAAALCVADARETPASATARAAAALDSGAARAKLEAWVAACAEK